MRNMTIFIGLITVLWILSAAWGRYYNYRNIPSWHPDKVSVLIPAWNESKVIRRTVESILRYPYEFDLEIVIVDDGSTDNTWEILQQLRAEYPSVKIYDKENGGKAKALNYGLFIGVTSDYTLIIDADTIVANGETIPRMARWFVDPKIGVVAGRTKAGYRGKGLLERMLAEFQSAEYDLGIAVLRTAQDWMNGIVIVPGSCSMFRTALLREINGFKSHLIAEDAAAGHGIAPPVPGDAHTAGHHFRSPYRGPAYDQGTVQSMEEMDFRGHAGHDGPPGNIRPAGQVRRAHHPVVVVSVWPDRADASDAADLFHDSCHSG